MPRYIVQCDPKTGECEIRKARFQGDDSIALIATGDDAGFAYIKAVGAYVDLNPDAPPAIRDRLDKVMRLMEEAIAKAQKGKTDE